MVEFGLWVQVLVVWVCIVLTTGRTARKSTVKDIRTWEESFKGIAHLNMKVVLYPSCYLLFWGGSVEHKKYLSIYFMHFNVVF